MRVGVVGAGAMGSVFAGFLAAAGHDVALLCRTAAQAEAVRREGLLLSHGGERRLTRPRACEDGAALGPVDLALIWVKSQDTAAALARAAPLIGPATIVASFQNGLGNVRAIAATVPEDRIVQGVSTVGGVRRGLAHVEVAESTWSGAALTWIGAVGRGGVDLEALAAELEGAGLQTEARADIETIVWSKLAMSAPMTAISTLARCPVGAVIDSPHLESLRLRASEEVIAVGTAAGVPLRREEVLRRCLETYESVRGHLPSMLQDAQAGRPTEIESLAGAVAREADRLGLEAPVNELLWRLVAGSEAASADPLQPG